MRLHLRQYEADNAALTGFGQKQAFLEEVRDQTKQGDEASQCSADNIEIGYRKGRHIQDGNGGGPVLANAGAVNERDTSDSRTPEHQGKVLC